MGNLKDNIYKFPNGVKALVVMAADAEFGDNLKALGINPLITGVGPVQAASEKLLTALESGPFSSP